MRFSFIVTVPLTFAEGLLVFDWMYVMNRQCESREDHRKKQTEWHEEYVTMKLSHKERLFCHNLNIPTQLKRNEFLHEEACPLGLIFVSVIRGFFRASRWMQTGRGTGRSR